MFEAVPRSFNTQYRCYSVVMFPGNEREDVERGGKSKLFYLPLIFYWFNMMSDHV